MVPEQIQALAISLLRFLPPATARPAGRVAWAGQKTRANASYNKGLLENKVLLFLELLAKQSL